MRLFRTGQVENISGLPSTTFGEWCHLGLVKAVAGGNGTGNHRVFDLPTVVGVAVAAELRASDRGCALSYISRVVEAFSGTDETELVKQFKKGETHFVMPHKGKPVLRGPDYDWVDVQRCYNRVVKAG